MLAPEIGSTNQGPETKVPVSVPGTTNDKAPLISRRRGHSSAAADGYVEFGSIVQSSSGRTLGTFAGVFSPVALSMFSALMFLRVGFIVGNAGLLVTLLQFAIAYGILLFTVASVCAISTNGAVEGGGAYFMISRTLGPEFGGSIGTLFFLANIVSSALYITGCAEGLVENFGPSGYLVGDGTGLPDGRWWRFLYCTLLNVLNLLVCLIGAAMFAKTSVAILGIVCICLLSAVVTFIVQGFKEVGIPDANEVVQNATYHVKGNFTGLMAETLHSNLFPDYGFDYSSGGQAVYFSTVFGVLFSGVTGIMAGANMSGELKEPARNIPRGTLSAVAFTFLCYVVVSLLTAASCSRFLLQNNFVFMMPISIWPPFIAVGIVTATFSASLSNLIGSSRVLEALAKDNVFGPLLNFVSRGVWRGNPIVAVLVSFVVVQLILFIGSLNTIAQVNSVLFLLSYLATNLACLGLELASAPNFRPSFHYFTWHTALVGLLGTLVMMFVINPIYASSSMVLCLSLVLMLHLFSPSRSSDWGSISQALIFHQVRKYLLLLDSRKDHVKFWRPQVLLMVGNPRTCVPLMHFVNDLKKGGLYVIGHIAVGSTDIEQDPTIEQYPHWLTLVDRLKVKAFVELTVAQSVREGLKHMMRMSGLGAMKPNTIVLGFYDDNNQLDFLSSDVMFDGVFPLRSQEQQKAVDVVQFVGMIADTLLLNKNVCVCRHFETLDKSLVTKRGGIKYIDVWPINLLSPSDADPFCVSSLFMLQLACIINMVPGWKTLYLRVFLCESSAESSTTSEHRLRQLLHQLRIACSIQQVPDWCHQAAALCGGSALPLGEAFPEQTVTDNTARAYLLSVNQLIKSYSDETAATFLYLARPPQDKQAYGQYLQLLTEMTADLPPTILVHGVSAVTSTTL